MNADCHYDAHGVSLSSDLALPEFPVAQGAAGPSLRIAAEEALPLPEPGSGERHWVDAAGFHVAWEQVGTFQVTPGGDISYRRVPGASDELIRVPLLGSVLSVALHYRGTLVMHGNALSLNGQGIILVGAKGQGKSTLSAALIHRGHLIQAEDAASVSVAPDGAAVAFHGTRQLRLWSDSVTRAFGQTEPFSRQIHELSDKRVVPLTDQPETPARLPLRRLYVLEDAAEIASDPRDAAEAWQTLLVHSLVSRFGTSLLQGPRAARHFGACAALSKAVPCHRLRRPRDFSYLDAVAAHIEEDVCGG